MGKAAARHHKAVGTRPLADQACWHLHLRDGRESPWALDLDCYLLPSGAQPGLVDLQSSHLALGRGSVRQSGGGSSFLTDTAEMLLQQSCSKQNRARRQHVFAASARPQPGWQAGCSNESQSPPWEQQPEEHCPVSHRNAEHQPHVQGRQQRATQFIACHEAGISACISKVTSNGAHLCQGGSSNWLPPKL